ncbi:hypothetical protein D3C83_264900 [compost metagenome]
MEHLHAREVRVHESNRGVHDLLAEHLRVLLVKQSEADVLQYQGPGRLRIGRRLGARRFPGRLIGFVADAH